MGSLVLNQCAVFSPATIPTLIPAEDVPTVIALTSQALIAAAASPTPEHTPTPTEISISLPTPTNPPSHSPTAGPTATQAASPTPPAPFEIPYAEIQIMSPGALSRISSPLKLHLFLTPGHNGRVRVELFGEDGRLMYRHLFVSTQFPGVQTNIHTEIDFEIIGVAEMGRLVVSTDDEYGRVKELATSEVFLLGYGESEINPSGDHLAPIIIQEPVADVLIQGKNLIVSGLARTHPDHVVLVELITTDRKLIGNRVASVAAEPEGGHRAFFAEVPYSVETPTWVRVTVSELGQKWSGAVQLASTTVLLSP